MYSKFSNFLHNSPKFQLVFTIALGQAISLLITFTAVASQALSQFYNYSIPSLQNFLNYFFIFSFSVIVVLLKRDNIVEAAKKRGIAYFALAFCDVEASFFIVKAYDYTTITSVMVLDCFTIPVVMILSYFIFTERYNFIQYLSVFVAIIGMLLLLLSDSYSSDGSSSSTFSIILGDVMVLIACIFYGISNVGEQYYVGIFSIFEFLFFYGLFGSILCGIQMILFNYDELMNIEWEWQMLGWILLYSLSLFMVYILVPLLLRVSNAVVFNLSLLTADAYSLLFGIYFFGEELEILYFVSLIVTLTGLIIYNLFGPQGIKFIREKMLEMSLKKISEEEANHQTSLPVTHFEDNRDHLQSNNENISSTSNDTPL